MSDTAPPGGVAEQVSPEKWSQPVDRTQIDLDAELSSRSAMKKQSSKPKHRDSDTSAMKSPYNQPVLPPVTDPRSSMPASIGDTLKSNAKVEESKLAVEDAAPESSEEGKDADNNGATSEPDAPAATRPESPDPEPEPEPPFNGDDTTEAAKPAEMIYAEEPPEEDAEQEQNAPSDEEIKRSLNLKRDTRFFDKLKNRVPSPAVTPAASPPASELNDRRRSTLKLEPLDHKRETSLKSTSSSISGSRLSMILAKRASSALLAPHSVGGHARSSTNFTPTTMDMVDALAADQEDKQDEDPSDDEAGGLLPAPMPLSDEKDMTANDGGASPKQGGVKFNDADSTDGRQTSSAYKRITSLKKATFSSVFDFKEDDAPKWRQRVLTFMDSTVYVAFSLVLIVLALFADDIRLAICPPAADIFFEILAYFLLAAFALEMVVLSIVKPNYLFSFYFFLDFIATASLVFDLPEIQEAILDSATEESAESTNLMRASRSSRIGTRAGRVARVVRVMRLVRMLKVYKMLSMHLQKMSKRTIVQEHHGDDDLDEDGNPRTAESRVGVKLTELTTRRVIVGVLLMLFILPLFAVEGGLYGGPDPFAREGLYMVHNIYMQSGQSQEFNISLATYENTVGYAVAGKTTGGILSLSVADMVVANETTDHRETEMVTYVVNCTDTEVEVIMEEYSDDDYGGDAGSCYASIVTVDNKWPSQLEAILNIGRTLFVTFILGFGALLFSRDANSLVLHPLERMVQKVKEMSENPLAKMQIRAVATKDEQQMETRILENSITKICSLLAVGFGDAGAEVVAENIRNGGDLNPMVPGHRMMAIFGFCDIRRFTDATEVLQEEVMEFVNSIAKIVHMEVSLHGGSANKNIGDAFLLVWKLPAQLLQSDAMVDEDLALAASNLPQDKRNSVAYLADRALAAFVVIQVALKRSPRLKQFCMRDDIRKRMGDNFRVSMGFGLHIGWAIEGAIGSEYKIDASYLSPNVNMASRLEAATKQFGTSILMSDDFAMMLSPRVRKLCRAIDVITVKGSNKPVTLYTYDISLTAIAEPDENKFQDDNMENLSHSFLSFKSEFEENPDITESIGSTQSYRDHFALGFQAYLDGQWEEARDLLLSCLNRVDPSGCSCTDGPTASLLEVMGRSDFIAPRSWDGVRHLTDK